MSQQATSVITIDNSLADTGKRSATISIPGHVPYLLTYESYDGPLSIDSGDDAFLLAALLMLMEAGHEVHVHGRITSRLLINLHELQLAWARWRPSKYHVVPVTADEVLSTNHTDGPAISAFSGGVDASYTVYKLKSTSSLIDLQSVIFVHGFDIPLNCERDYISARTRGEQMLAQFNLHTIGIKTNLRDLPQSWEDIFGLAVASCLVLFQDQYPIGLIGSSEPYDELVLPWGSSPVTDHLYTSGMMDIRHYGAGSSRTDKMELLSSWPEGLRHLRVCWQGERGDANCGRCEKCIRTYLNFRAVGANNLECFEHVPSRSDVRLLRAASRAQLNELKSIVKYAESRGIQDPWLSDLRIAIAASSLLIPIRSNPKTLQVARSIKRNIRPLIENAWSQSR